MTDIEHQERGMSGEKPSDEDFETARIILEVARDPILRKYFKTTEAIAMIVAAVRAGESIVAANVVVDFPGATP